MSFLGRAGLRWPSNARAERAVVFEGDPLEAGVIGAIDRNGARGMDGRTGTVIIGEHDEHRTWFGYSGIIIAPDPGATTSLLRSPNVALPSTASGAVDSPGSVSDLLARLPLRSR